MNKPKMIIFDAGKTLFHYHNVDTSRGVREYCRYLTKNPRKLTVEEIDGEVSGIFETFEAARKQLFEVHEQTVLKLAFDLLELEFSVSIPEIEKIIWENDAAIVPVTGTKELLTWLNSAGIRTAVISNLCFSGYLLKERLDWLYPQNRFEFVIASSDYGIRKPERRLFEAGIVHANLKPEEIWYIGDNLAADVEGAKNCGMVPVLYKSEFNQYGEISSEVLSVGSYAELKKIMQNL